MKNLVRCPNCEFNGKKEVLGEINENGDFVVMRFHKGSTIISGDNLKVKCGVCGEEVYRKEAKYDERGSVGIVGVFRQTFMSSFGTV
jgi:endogenous inhibitor of DNA gyrase (YacG/DUF329 family)